MNAKRRTSYQETGSDELMEQENAELAAEGEGMPPDAAPGDEYDPAKPHIRPGQGRERDDAKDAAYRQSQGSLAGDEGVPGAGDPQNGVLTPPGKSPVSWADISR